MKRYLTGKVRKNPADIRNAYVPHDAMYIVSLGNKPDPRGSCRPVRLCRWIRAFFITATFLPGAKVTGGGQIAS